MKNSDLLPIGTLAIILLVIFYPVFYAEYLYTDEAVQIWHYKQPGSLEMFLPQGRYLTEKLMQWLFKFVTTIKDLAYLRLFSLFGWLVCIPVWYYVLKQIALKEKLPALLAFFSVLYLITMPPMAVSISWATCSELFLANTAGLLSGYCLLTAITTDEKEMIQVSSKALMLAVLLGLISLFSYQSGFGCFLIPFLIHFINQKSRTRTLIIGVGVYLFICLVYYLVFKYNLKLNNIAANERTGLYLNPWGKLKFFFSQPLAAAFHFTYLFDEKSWLGILIYRLLLAALLLFIFMRYNKISILARVQYVAGLGALFMLMYIPPLIVKENYASNRTLLALNVGIFILIAEIVLALFKNRFKYTVVYFVSVLLVLNAWYNFNYIFLKPVVQEYAGIRSFLKTNYSPDVNTIFFIRPPEDLFVRRFNIAKSWDEFGVPSTLFNWVPEPYVKQLIFEMTKNRAIAEKLVVKHSLHKQDFKELASKSVLIIDAAEIMQSKR